MNNVFLETVWFTIKFAVTIITFHWLFSKYKICKLTIIRNRAKCDIDTAVTAED